MSLSTNTQPVYECSTWFERDRANVTLTDTSTGKEIFSLWDEEVAQAIEDGFLLRPKVPHPSDADWLPSAIAYAITQDLL